MKCIPIVLLCLLSISAPPLYAQTANASTHRLLLTRGTYEYAAGQPYAYVGTGYVMLRDEVPRSGVVLSLAGIAGFGVGVAAGTLVGYAIQPNSEDLLFPVTAGMLIGGIAGGALGAPLGVHLANKRRGNLWLAGLASGAVAATIVPLSQSRAFPAILALPFIQIGVSVAIERVTSD